jgi:polyadenylation factor subunit 2
MWGGGGKGGKGGGFGGPPMHRPPRNPVYSTAPIIRLLQSRKFERDFRDRPALQPNHRYKRFCSMPSTDTANPAMNVCARFVSVAMSKTRCPVFKLAWTPRGDRLITGNSIGEFSLWDNGTFSKTKEGSTINDGSSFAIRGMEWSHDGKWLVSADHGGFIKYWNPQMRCMSTFQAHQAPIRGLSFAPTDYKFATGSEDQTIKIWDFEYGQDLGAEQTMKGHGWNLCSVEWHPQKSLIASGAKVRKILG